MKKLKSSSTFYAQGRGMVALVDLGRHRIHNDQECPLKVGEIILLNDEEVEILEIETFKTATNPPRLKPEVGIVYKSK
jgi:hypothetical protein